MIQWLKRFIEEQGGPDDQYDPIARRGKVEVDFNIASLKKGGLKNK